MVSGQLQVNLSQVFCLSKYTHIHEHAQLLFSVPSLKSMVTNMTLTLYVGHTVEHSVTSGTVVKWNIRGEGIVRQLGPQTGGCVPRAFFF